MAVSDPDVQALLDQATKNTEVEASATLLINGFADRIAKAVAAAGSLNAADRAAINAEIAAMKSSADAAGTAVAANTPAA